MTGIGVKRVCDQLLMSQLESESGDVFLPCGRKRRLLVSAASQEALGSDSNDFHVLMDCRELRE
jgi:hypothetical protein